MNSKKHLYKIILNVYSFVKYFLVSFGVHVLCMHACRQGELFTDFCKNGSSCECVLAKI